MISICTGTIATFFWNNSNIGNICNHEIGNKCNLLEPRFNLFGCRYLNRIILGIRHCHQQACMQDGIPCKLACIGMGRYDEGMKSF